MIGGASLPNPTLPSPAHEAHSPANAHERAEASRAAPDDARDADAPAQAGHAQAHDTSGPRAAAQARRNARRDGGGRDANDDASSREAFARLLDAAPASAEPTKPAVQTAATASKPDDHADASKNAPATALPDQLLGLLASLVPGAQAAPAQAHATTSAAPLPTPADPAAVAQAATTSKPATPPVVADVVGGLLPTLQASDATAAIVAATPAFAAATKAEESGTPLPVLHDASRADTPSPTPFDALLRAPGVTVADVPRPVVPATPTAVPQPANPNAGYGDELGTSVVWMAEQRIGHAEVRVVPDHLGPIDVRLQLDGAQVHATFLSAQPDVRHALEASLPRLRDLLGQHGLELAQADVGQRQQDPRAARGAQQASGDARETGDAGFAPTQAAPRARVVRGLLDEYA